MSISLIDSQPISMRPDDAVIAQVRYSADSKPTNEYSALWDIINNNRIQTVFQSIFDLKTGEIYAYESLARHRETKWFTSTEALFQGAQKHQMTRQLESLCRQNTYLHMARLGLEKPVSVNISPYLLQTRNLDLLNELYVVQDKIILELTERYSIRDQERFAENIEFYRQTGFTIAIDDLGAGFAGLGMLARIQPAIVKIDRFIIAGIQHSTKKQMLLEAMVSFCHKINALVVAEGVEDAEELKTILPMKVDLAQGFFLAKPTETPGNCSSDAKKYIDEYRVHTTIPCTSASTANSIGALVSHTTPIDARDTVARALEIFRADKSISALPVVDGKKPVGILNRTEAFAKIGHQFGFSLFSQKNVAAIMKPGTVFDVAASIEEVARKVLDRNTKSIYDAIIVVRNYAYVGTVQIYQLLQCITEQKIRLAKQANPLTSLPGNNLIEDEILQRLAKKEIFAVLYIDLNNFKPFNDNFGFEKGDQVLRYLGHMLEAELHRWDQNAFTGHVGGDDFVMVCRSGQVDALCCSIITRFEDDIEQFHDQESIRNKFYWSHDRLGRKTQYPLLTISIAVVTTDHRAFQSYGQLVSVAAEIKKKVKNNGGNSYYVDKRNR